MQLGMWPVKLPFIPLLPSLFPPMAGWQVGIEIFDARKQMVPWLTAFYMAIKRTLSVGILTACGYMLPHWLFDTILLAAVRAHIHLISWSSIWPMLGPLMLTVALFGGIFLVALSTGTWCHLHSPSHDPSACTSSPASCYSSHKETALLGAHPCFLRRYSILKDRWHMEHQVSSLPMAGTW